MSLFSAPLGVTDPPINTSITETLAPSGTVGVLATLTTPELGIICSDFKTVESGPLGFGVKLSSYGYDYLVVVEDFLSTQDPSTG